MVEVIGQGELRFFKNGAWQSLGEPLPTVTVSGTASDTTITVGGVDYRLVTWESSGEMVVSGGDLSGVEFVLVGGGGGGGGAASNRAGGGGGGGGVVDSVGSPQTVSSGTATVVVGAGGASGYGYRKGSNTSFSQWVAIGGGCGASTGTLEGFGQSGACGGGNSDYSTDGIVGRGFIGSDGGRGNGAGTGNKAAGGGGGHSAVGGNATSSPVAAGNGGNGFATTITGSSQSFAGGGGGGSQSVGTAGLGVDGGADGGLNASGLNATDGTGGGGGGGARDNVGGGRVGGEGGDGIVIVRWPVANQA